jgi:hypothetical protein
VEKVVDVLVAVEVVEVKEVHKREVHKALIQHREYNTIKT